MKTRGLKYFGVKRGMLRDVEHCVKDLYVKVTIKSLTMLGTTPRVRSETYVLVWSVVTQIVHDNPHIKDTLTKVF